MPDRNLDFSPTVTSVTAKMPDQGAIEGAADLADTIAQQSANSKALNASAQTALAFRQLDAQYRESTAGNPNDPEALKSLQSARQQIVSNIGQQVPAIASREYQTKAITLGESSDKMNELWGMHQQMRNADDDLVTANDTHLKIANMAGQQFGADSGDMGNLNSVLNYEGAQQDIKQFVVPVIGAPKAEEYLKDFSSNWVKSFVAGVAEKSPQMAATMLDRPEIAEHFTSQDIGDMADVIKKTARQQQLIQSMQTTKADGSLTDIANDPNTSYFEKRATIDKLDATGAVSPKAASAARRVIKSTEDLDSQTDTPAMADIINKTYDLNANASTSADDYLTGVKNIHQNVLEAQANGTLTGADAAKVTRQVNDLTGKKLSDATNTAGMEFYDANQKFNDLPPEYRGQATRALFYAGQGQNWTPQQYSNQATQITQQINTQRRQQAMKTVSGVPQGDTDFLKSINASPADVQETAAKHGLSAQQVILRLRADEVAKQRAKQNGVKKIVGGDEGGDENDDHIEIPKKASALTPTDNIDEMEEQGTQ